MTPDAVYLVTLQSCLAHGVLRKDAGQKSPRGKYQGATLSGSPDFPQPRFWQVRYTRPKLLRVMWCAQIYHQLTLRYVANFRTFIDLP
jgi:hypothetical protein